MFEYYLLMAVVLLAIVFLVIILIAINKRQKHPAETTENCNAFDIDDGVINTDNDALIDDDDTFEDEKLMNTLHPTEGGEQKSDWLVDALIKAAVVDYGSLGIIPVVLFELMQFRIAFQQCFVQIKTVQW